MTDLGTTPRKPLTRVQRLKLFEQHKGICALCSQPIRGGEAWIDEHLRALGLGGSNDADNRAPAHKACADAKTHGPEGDIAVIAKAKRQKMQSLGIKRPSTLQGQGFRKFEPAHRATRPVEKLTLGYVRRPPA
jgi:hypothetical protein